MGISWGAMAGSFLAPFLYGLYSKKITTASVWCSFAVGVGLTVSNLFLKFIASPINAGAIAMLISLVVVPLVSTFTKKQDAARIEEIFSCYENKVTVPAKAVLIEEEHNQAAE